MGTPEAIMTFGARPRTAIEAENSDIRTIFFSILDN
jgi:hypothetical protein